MNPQKGEIFCFNKPYTWTSFDLVSKVRGILRHRTRNRKLKIGHAGTLDPLATGVLLICSGKATKRIDELQAGVKEYVATLKLGATTPSFDKESQEEHGSGSDGAPEMVLLADRSADSLFGCLLWL